MPMAHLSKLLETVRGYDLMIPYNHQEIIENVSVNKPRSTYWMKDPNKPIPEAWMKKFESWSFAHREKKRLSCRTKITINRNIRYRRRRRTRISLSN